MSQVKFKGQPIKLAGQRPSVGQTAPDFNLVRADLTEISLEKYQGKKKILNVTISLDTPTCATSVREFNSKASKLPNVVVLNISADLPFALKRFCAAEGLPNVEALSTFRSNFPKAYGLVIAEGPLQGLCARAVIILDESNHVIYEELVPELANEPNYQKALEAVNK